jgi:hypothetical protein
MAREPNQVAKSNTKKESPKKSSRSEPATPKTNAAATQEAKDLRALAQALNAKNSPETSKDITAFAKDTIRMVAKSQKSDSAAFKREATKALVEFRNFVEQTQKVTESRRASLLRQIDSVNLDTKNAAVMMISIARNQAQLIKDSAKNEAKMTKEKSDAFHKNLVAEATAKARQITDESKLKSKALFEEKSSKLKELKMEQKQRLENLVQAQKETIERAKLKLQQDKADHKVTLEKKKQDLKDQSVAMAQHYDNLKTQLKDQADIRRKKLDQDKVDHKVKVQQDQDQLRTDRAVAAGKIKQLKSDLRNDYQLKVTKHKSDIAQQKADQLQRNKDRIQKIRELGIEHKARLKKIEDDAKGEGIIRKAALRKQLADQSKKEAKSNRDADKFKDTLKSGFFEANPVAAAGVEVFKGVKGLLAQNKAKKQRNTLQHSNSTAKAAPSGKVAPPPANGASNAPAAANSSGGGMFGGLLGMIPGVSGIISGIGSLFSGIVGAFGKVGSLVMGVGRFLPVIAGVSAVIGGIFSFLEGFNDASSIFGEKVEDDNYTKRVYAGFTNVVSSILGLFDTVAGWLGFDTDLAGGFKQKAVALFDKIIDCFKGVVGGIADLLKYIPGMGGVAKSMKEYASAPTGSIQPNQASQAAAVVDKTAAVNNLKDDVEASKAGKSNVQVVSDNSVRQNSTTIVSQPLTTRNDDKPKLW